MFDAADEQTKGTLLMADWTGTNHHVALRSCRKHERLEYMLMCSVVRVPVYGLLPTFAMYNS